LKRILFLIVFLSLLFGFTACNKNSGDSNPPSTNARLIIVNASPDAPPLGLYVNQVSIFSNLTYEDSTGYFEVGPGIYVMNIFKTDTTNYYQQDTTVITTDTVLYVSDSVTYYKMDTFYTPTDTVIYQADTMVTLQSPVVNLKAGFYYSLFLIDSVNKLETTFISDSILAAPTSDSAKLRFFHFSVNAPAFDLAESGGGAVLFSNRTFNDINTAPSYARFSTLHNGTYNLELRLAGTSTVVATLPNVVLGGGKIYTLYSRGSEGGTNAQAISIGIIGNN
jgi:hypothetical protein